MRGKHGNEQDFTRSNKGKPSIASFRGSQTLAEGEQNPAAFFIDLQGGGDHQPKRGRQKKKRGNELG